jgi:hypothetical protein
VSDDPLPLPTGVSATDGTFSNRVCVDWSPADLADTYDVLWGRSNETASAMLVATDLQTNSWCDEDVTPGQVGYYWVRAKYPVGDSEPSVPDSGYRLGEPEVPEVAEIYRAGGQISVGTLSVTGRFYWAATATNILGPWVTNPAVHVGIGRMKMLYTNALPVSPFFFKFQSQESN